MSDLKTCKDIRKEANGVAEDYKSWSRKDVVDFIFERMFQEASNLLKNSCIYSSGFAIKIGEGDEKEDFITEVDEFIEWFFNIKEHYLK